MLVRRVYMDSSAITKRYVKEEGTETAQEIYSMAENGSLMLIHSIWNIGEVLGVLDQYRRRGWHHCELVASLRIFSLYRIEPIQARAYRHHMASSPYSASQEVAIHKNIFLDVASLPTRSPVDCICRRCPRRIR